MPHLTCTLVHGPSIGPFAVEFSAGDSPRRDEYTLRHRVFVEEHRWLEPAVSGEPLERDEFDHGACACLLREEATGEVVACQRLILPDRLPPGHPTPVEQFTPGFELQVGHLHDEAWAEVSRTCIARPYRCGRRHADVPASTALQVATLALAVALGRPTLFSYSERATARLLRRIGIAMESIGPAIEYHGRRVPYRIDVAAVLDTLPRLCGTNLNDLVSAAEALR